MYPQYVDPAKQRRDDLILGLIVFNVVLTIILGWLVYSKIINRADTSSKKSTSSSESSSSASSSNDFDRNEASGSQENLSYTQEQQTQVQTQIASRNVQRKNDASRVVTAALEYISNNTGTLPTMFEDGKLRGTDPNDYPSTIEFQYYTSLVVHFSAQPAAESDTIVLVTGASCGSNGSTVDGSSRSVAVLYGEEANNGSFKGVCVDS